MAWLKSNGFSCNVVEAKAVFNQAAGRYISSQAIPGMSDIIGNDQNGVGVYIELKAKGRLSTVSYKQINFLKEKISTNCFAVCVDSADMLDKMYRHWLKLKKEERFKYLMETLER